MGIHRKSIRMRKPTAGLLAKPLGVHTGTIVNILTDSIGLAAQNTAPKADGFAARLALAVRRSLQAGNPQKRKKRKESRYEESD